MSLDSNLFNPRLNERFAASIQSTPEQRLAAADQIMTAAKLPREGTSGAANAYLIFVGTEFGAISSPEHPTHLPDEFDEAGWRDLWRLRVGEPNPHFLPQLERFRNARPLWRNLYDWLPDVFGGDRIKAHSTFAWTNLSVTKGGRDKGTSTSHAEGMREHVLPLIEASHAKAIIATNNPAPRELTRWVNSCLGHTIAIAGMQAWKVNIAGRHVVAAVLGGHPSHPNQFMSTADFVQRVRSVLATAEALGSKEVAK